MSKPQSALTQLGPSRQSVTHKLSTSQVAKELFLMRSPLSNRIDGQELSLLQRMDNIAQFMLEILSREAMPFSTQLSHQKSKLIHLNKKLNQSHKVKNSPLTLSKRKLKVKKKMS